MACWAGDTVDIGTDIFTQFASRPAYADSSIWDQLARAVKKRRDAVSLSTSFTSVGGGTYPDGSFKALSLTTTNAFEHCWGFMEECRDLLIEAGGTSIETDGHLYEWRTPNITTALSLLNGMDDPLSKDRTEWWTYIVTLRTAMANMRYLDSAPWDVNYVSISFGYTGITNALKNIHQGAAAWSGSGPWVLDQDAIVYPGVSGTWTPECAGSLSLPDISNVIPIVGVQVAGNPSSQTINITSASDKCSGSSGPGTRTSAEYFWYQCKQANATLEFYIQSTDSDGDTGRPAFDINGDSITVNWEFTGYSGDITISPSSGSFTISGTIPASATITKSVPVTVTMNSNDIPGGSSTWDYKTDMPGAAGAPFGGAMVFEASASVSYIGMEPSKVHNTYFGPRRDTVLVCIDHNGDAHMEDA